MTYREWPTGNGLQGMAYREWATGNGLQGMGSRDYFIIIIWHTTLVATNKLINFLASPATLLNRLINNEKGFYD
jgi:hypothetical protein